MAKHHNTARKEAREELRAGSASPEQLAREIEESRALLDKGHSSEAEARLVSVIEAAADAPTLMGQARSVLSEALEWQGRFNEALEVVRLYDAAEARAGLEFAGAL